MFAEHLYTGSWSHHQRHVKSQRQKVMFHADEMAGAVGGPSDTAAICRDLRSVTPGGTLVSPTPVSLPFLDATPSSVIERIRSRSVVNSQSLQDQIAHFGGRTVTYLGSTQHGGSSSRGSTAHHGTMHLQKGSTSFTVLNGTFSRGGSHHNMMPMDPLGTMSDPFNLSVTWPSPTKVPRTPVSLPPPSRGGRRLLEPLVTPPNGSRSGSGSDREGSAVPNIRMALTPKPGSRCPSGIRPVIPPLTPRGNRSDQRRIGELDETSAEEEEDSSCGSEEDEGEEDDDDDVTVRFREVALPARSSHSGASTRDSGVSSASCRDRGNGSDGRDMGWNRQAMIDDDERLEAEYLASQKAAVELYKEQHKKSVTFQPSNDGSLKRRTKTSADEESRGGKSADSRDSRLNRPKARYNDIQQQLPKHLQRVTISSSSEDENIEDDGTEGEDDDDDVPDEVRQRSGDERWSTDGLYDNRRKRADSMGHMRFNNNGRVQYEADSGGRTSYEGKVRRPPPVDVDHTPLARARSVRAPRHYDEIDSEPDDYFVAAEDPNEISLSGTMRSKLELLQKKKENMAKIEQRKMQASEERARKYRELQAQANALSPPPSEIALHQSKSRRNSLTSRKYAPEKSAHPGQRSPMPPRTAGGQRSPMPPRTAGGQRSPMPPQTAHAKRTPPKTPGAKRPVTRGAGVTASLKSRSFHDISSSTWATNSTNSSLKSGASSGFGSMRNLSSKSPSVRTSCFPDNLPPFKDPQAGFHEAVRKMDAEDWEKNLDGIQDIVRLCEHHPDVATQNLKELNLSMMKQVRNLRSQVSRAALQAYVELFSTLKRHMEPYLDKVGPLLLQKTGETNKFIREDCNYALESMVDSVSPAKCSAVLVSEGLTHKNNTVRGATSRLITRIVEKMGSAKFFAKNNQDLVDKLLPAAVKLVSDGNPEARHHAKRFLTNVMDHADFHSSITKYVPASQMRSFEKTLDQIRTQTKNGQLLDTAVNLNYSSVRPKMNRTM